MLGKNFDSSGDMFWVCSGLSKKFIQLGSTYNKNWYSWRWITTPANILCPMQEYENTLG